MHYHSQNYSYTKIQLYNQQKQMQEERVLREVTNLPDHPSPNDKPHQTKNKIELFSNHSFTSEESQQSVRPPLEQLLALNVRQLNFGECLPGSIHEKSFVLSVLEDLPFVHDLTITIICNDEALSDSPQLIFGIKQSGQHEYYDDYRIKVKSKKKIEFRVGAKTPMYYYYDVKCILVIQLEDYAPMVMMLKQIAQLPELSCPKQLCLSETEESNRVIKLSIIQNKSKRECRIPFKLNHNMNLSMAAEIMSLQRQGINLIDIKPKMMTLTGKGQFSLLVVTNYSEEIKKWLSKGKVYTVRRVLTLTIRETKFIYHFPLEITYHPSNQNNKPNID